MSKSNNLCIRILLSLMAAAFAGYLGSQLPFLILHLLGFSTEYVFGGSIARTVGLLNIPSDLFGMAAACQVMRWLDFFKTMESVRSLIAAPPRNSPVTSTLYNIH